MFFSVYHYFERTIKPDMPDEAVFINYFEAIQKINIIITFIDKGVNGKIPDPERSKILKEMCPLAWINPVIL